MTISEAISEINELWPSQYSRTTLTKWLLRLDEQIYREVFLTHEHCPERTEGTLLVPYPYDYDIYINYLHSQIDRQNGEIDRYNVSAELFNTAYQKFGNYWNRNNKALPAPQFDFRPTKKEGHRWHSPF